VILVAFDDKAQITLLNRKGYEVLGYEPGELEGKSWFATCLPANDPEGIFSIYKKIIAGDIKPYEYFENQILTKSGEKRFIAWHNLLLKDDQGNNIGTLSSGEDITDRKIAEKELLLALESAKNATIVKSRFLDIAAHELRTPVSAFSLLVQLAQKKIDQGMQVDPNIFVRLRKQVDRISQLVIDLLDVSRLERGAMKLKIERKDVVSLLSDCVEDIKLRSPHRHFKVMIPSGTPIVANIDVIRIYQVISNLLDNAVKYTPEDSPIEVSVEVKQGAIHFFVTDHGPGISKQQQDEMFQPFTRGSTELTDPSGGLGLGLFICKSIIMLHGGSMEVSSEIGHGSTFTFHLPL